VTRRVNRAADADAALRPIMLGVFPHREASACGCGVPNCVEAAVGFLTVLWRGVVALPVCHDHGVQGLQHVDKVPPLGNEVRLSTHAPVMVERPAASLLVRRTS